MLIMLVEFIYFFVSEREEVESPRIIFQASSSSSLSVWCALSPPPIQRSLARITSEKENVKKKSLTILGFGFGLHKSSKRIVVANLFPMIIITSLNLNVECDLERIGFYKFKKNLFNCKVELILLHHSIFDKFN